MAYNVFGGLVKITGNKWASYVSKKNDNKFTGFIFADILEEQATIDARTDDKVNHSGKYIFANGVEYKVQDAAAFDTLKSSFESYVTATNSSIARLDSSVSGLETWKSNLKFLVDNNVVKIAEIPGELRFDGNYVKVTADANDSSKLSVSLNIATTKDDIEKTTDGSTLLVNTVALKSYVENQLGDIDNAFTFEGGCAELAKILANTPIPEVTSKTVGNTYVIDVTTEGKDKYEFTFDGKEYFLELGDTVFVKSVADGKVTGITVVERNLTGAVTTSGTLAENKVVVGAGKQGVKDSGYVLGVDSSAAFVSGNDASMLATVKGTKSYVDQEIRDAVSELAVSAAGDSYVSAATDTTDNKKINVAANVANLGDVTATGKLADAYDVSTTMKSMVSAVDGSLSFVAVEGSNNEVKVEHFVNGHEHSVNVKSTDENLKISVVDSKLVLDLSTATLADASNGSTGLALAEDVYRVITDNENVTATAIDNIKGSVGLNDGLGTSDEFKAKFGDKTISQAVIDLSTDLASASAALDQTISDAIDSSIKLLDVNDSSVAGQMVVKVSETDGKVQVGRAGLKVNTVTAGSDANGNITVTIDGSNVSVGGSSTHKDKAISTAIADLSTAIDSVNGAAVKTVTGETGLVVVEGTTVNDDYVSVTATRNGDTVTLDSSIRIANAPSVSTGTAADATGLATDAYVKNAIQNALMWEEI